MNAEKTTKAYGYCRVSTVDQVNGTSLESQQDRITAIAKLHGYELVEIFIEGGVSGKIPLKHREEGKRLLQLVQDGDVIIASKMDRLFRSLSDAVAMSKKWQEANFYGGLGSENVTQAVSRDILADAMVRLEHRGFPIILHCHDETVVEAKQGTMSYSVFISTMSEVPTWAQGLPIAVEGWRGTRYRKA